MRRFWNSGEQLVSPRPVYPTPFNSIGFGHNPVLLLSLLCSPIQTFGGSFFVEWNAYKHCRLAASCLANLQQLTHVLVFQGPSLNKINSCLVGLLSSSQKYGDQSQLMIRNKQSQGDYEACFTILWNFLVAAILNQRDFPPFLALHTFFVLQIS